MAARNYQSIGEVLVSLKTEFPDITISKIRFLESEGLIAPERTPSGYRKFYEQDIDKLRSILRMQRDEYLPLKVIKERLIEEEVAGPIVETDDVPMEEVDELAEPVSGLRMSLEEMASSTGVEKDQILELEKVGILCTHGEAPDLHYDGDDYLLLSIVKDLLRHGFEPRHLTKYRRFEEDEAFFFQSIVDPLRKQRNPDAHRAAEETLQDLARLSRRLKQALLSIRLREYMAG
jgi:DNA-binding transcriptional MerR regulator